MDGALKYFKQSAAMGNAEAQFSLGTYGYQGVGVPVNYFEAMKWVRKAAEQGLPRAEGFLGLNYILGRGVPKNLVEAWAWLDIAAANGEPRAAQSLLEVTSKLPQSQFELAQARAREIESKIKSKKITNLKSYATKSSLWRLFISDSSTQTNKFNKCIQTYFH